MNSKSSNELTITFDCHGGTEIQNQVVKKGEKLKEPEAPTKEGYEFVGWYVDGEKFDFNTEITKYNLCTLNLELLQHYLLQLLLHYKHQFHKKMLLYIF